MKSIVMTRASGYDYNGVARSRDVKLTTDQFTTQQYMLEIAEHVLRVERDRQRAIKAAQQPTNRLVVPPRMQQHRQHRLTTVSERLHPPVFGKARPFSEIVVFIPAGFLYDYKMRVEHDQRDAVKAAQAYQYTLRGGRHV